MLKDMDSADFSTVFISDTHEQCPLRVYIYIYIIVIQMSRLKKFEFFLRVK